MKEQQKYLKILQRGAIILVALVFLLVGALIVAQSAPYLNFSLPLAVSQRGEDLTSAQEVAGAEEELFGTVVFKVQGGVSVPEAYLLINGKASGDFSEGLLYVRVYEGDQLTLDARRYQYDLIFEIEQMSSNIAEESLNAHLVLNNQTAGVGTVHFK